MNAPKKNHRYIKIQNRCFNLHQTNVLEDKNTHKQKKIKKKKKKFEGNREKKILQNIHKEEEKEEVRKKLQLPLNCRVHTNTTTLTALTYVDVFIAY